MTAVPGIPHADSIRIAKNTIGVVGSVRVGVSGVLPVREHDGRVRSRAVLHYDQTKREVFVGDVVPIDGMVHRVDIDVRRPAVHLSPVVANAVSSDGG